MIEEYLDGHRICYILQRKENRFIRVISISFLSVGLGLFTMLLLSWFRSPGNPSETKQMDPIETLSWLILSILLIAGSLFISRGRTIVTVDPVKRELSSKSGVGTITFHASQFRLDDIRNFAVKPMFERYVRNPLFYNLKKLTVVDTSNNEHDLVIGYSEKLLLPLKNKLQGFLDHDVTSDVKSIPDLTIQPGAEWSRQLHALSDRLRTHKGFSFNTDGYNFTFVCHPWGPGSMQLPLLFPLILIVLFTGFILLKWQAFAQNNPLILAGITIVLGLLLYVSLFIINYITMTLIVRLDGERLTIESSGFFGRKSVSFLRGRIKSIERTSPLTINNRPVLAISIRSSDEREQGKIFHLRFYKNDDLVDGLYTILKARLMEREELSSSG